MRQQGFALWSLLTFLLNAILFVLIGLQLPAILDGLAGESPAFLLGVAAAVSGVVIGARIVWALDDAVHHPRARPPPEPASRGGRAGASGSSRPGRACAARCRCRRARAAGRRRPQRDLIVFITFAVIFATLVLQGLTLPKLIRALRHARATTPRSARSCAPGSSRPQAALARIEELGARGLDARRHASSG